MATKQSTVDFLVEQMNHDQEITYRKMFGEYALYCEGKVIAFVCDDELFFKPTIAGRAFLEEVIEKPPYPGAKLYFWIPGDMWEDTEKMSRLVQVTTDELPLPKKKK